MEKDTAIAIEEATQSLLRHIADRNKLDQSDVVSVIFSVTKDLTALFPAKAAREFGWNIPMLDVCQMDIPGDLERCIRVLVHVTTQSQVQHVYLGGARLLRPDLEETT